MRVSIQRFIFAAFGLLGTIAAIALVGCDDSPAGSGSTVPDGSTGAPSAPPPGPPSGGAPLGRTQTFGPDLAALPGTTNVFTCADGYPLQTNAAFPQPFFGQGAQSCLVLTFAADPQGRTMQKGTVTSATIRVDGATGPMRFVRMRMLYSRASGQKCCSLEQYGEVFTPAVGQQTTVQLSFPMTEDHVPPENDLATIIANDFVAYEILAPNVPIPGYWPANGGPVPATASYMYLPAPSTQGVPAPSNVLLNHTGSYSGFLPAFTFTMVND